MHDDLLKPLPQSTSQTFSQVSSPPSRFKEFSFRRFEPMLKRYLQEYPDALVIRPNGLTCETTACRLRDAVKAVLRNPSWVGSVFYTDLMEKWPGTEVSHDGIYVRIGQRQAKTARGTFVEIKEQKVPSATSVLVLTTTSTAACKAAFELITTQNGEVSIRIPNTNLTSIQLLTDLYPNVEAFPDGNDIILL